MMASSSLDSPAMLKGKLTQVKYLLDDANERLREEASKYEIFTTKTSASGTSAANLQSRNNNNDNRKQIQADLHKTINDIGTLKSVLSCPIFNRIVNVTDSLDKLSYHLNLHPSISPMDINIDANGELILAPPIEPAALNNLINSRLDEYSDHSNNSPRIISPKLVNNGIANSILTNDQPHQVRQQPTNVESPTDIGSCSNGYMQPQIQAQQSDQTSLTTTRQQQQQISSQKHPTPNVQNYVPPSGIISTLNAYDTEKLVSNGTNKNYMISNKTRHQIEAKVSIENNGNDRPYKSNGQFHLDQAVTGNVEVRNKFQSTQSMNQLGNQVESGGNSYLNEMYRTTQELNQSEHIAIEHPQQTQLIGQNQSSYIKNVQNNNLTGNGRVQNSTSMQYNRGSCSPSTSAGSTVRLADECDSGASSYQSQTVKGAPCSPYDAYKSSDRMNDLYNVPTSPVQGRVDKMEQELNRSPEIERITVTLEKDDNGLGINIAGYVCEDDKGEVSGIIIKSITPNSPADRSGKIRELDQISSVNGLKLIGYSNHDAITVLKSTGKVVVLELERQLAEHKRQKLKSRLACVPASSSVTNKSRLSNVENIPTIGKSSTSTVSASPTKSQIPISKLRDSSNLSPTKEHSRPTLVQVSNYQQENEESIYKNGAALTTTIDSSENSASRSTSIHANINPQATPESHTPVAALRGGANKVIETKQGARNTIDIRAPACQTTTATTCLTSKAFEIENNSASNKSMTARLQEESSNDFGQLIRTEEPEWEKDAQIIEINKDASQGLGFTVKEYANPKDKKQSIIMITSITPGGIAERDGRLSFGDLLIFVDDTNLEGASLPETVKALKKTNGQVRLGVLKLKRTSTE